MNLEDDEVRRELDRIDPKDLCGVISLASTLFNIVYSALNYRYTFDALISISFILGFLSILHKNSAIAKASVGLLACHLAIIGALRLVS